MEDITFIILTKNEEKNISDCLRSVEGFAKRIVVVDSGSTDRTCSLAKEMGAEIYYHEFETHSKQFNWALDNVLITTKWTFRLDADERLTPQLCKELSDLMYLHDNDDVNGIVIEAWLYFLGRRIQHGCRNKRKLMMFKTGMARSENRRIDEHNILISGITVSANERFIHYDFKNMSTWIEKMNWYATREVQDYIDYLNGQKEFIDNDKSISKTRKMKYGLYYRLPMFFRCHLLFVYFYYLRGGFLDGKEGFVFHYMYHRWYRTLVDAKLLEYMIKKRTNDTITDV